MSFNIYLITLRNSSNSLGMRWLAVLFFMCLLNFGNLYSQTNKFDNEDKIDNLASALSQKHPNATISIYGYNKKSQYEKVFKSGIAQDQLQYNYEIGSITKTFNALLILDLLDGDMSFLSEKVGKYYPEFSEDVKNITVLQLLNHSSGLPGNFLLSMGEDPTKKLVAENVNKWFGKKKISTGKIGQFKYSNVGYVLLGLVIEKKFDRNWDQIMKEYIFSQGFENSFVASKNNSGSKDLQGMDKKGKPVNQWAFNKMAPAGAIVSNIDDLKVYLKLTSKYEKELEKNQYWNHIENKSNYSLSWAVDKLTDDINYYWHNGQTNGFFSYAGWLPKMDLGLIILINKSTDIDDELTLILNSIIANDNSTIK